jgi:hypothetical protein
VQETLAIVLDEGTPAPGRDQDIHDLILRLRGHLMRLGPSVPDNPSTSSAHTLRNARQLALADVPVGYMPARAHLRTVPLSVQAVLMAMGAKGLAYLHRPECPSAAASDHQAAQVRLRRPKAGCSAFCNGVLLLDDVGL